MQKEIIYTANQRVSCDGTNTKAGHPKIYLDIQHDKKAICPYCSRQFVFMEDQ